MKCNKNVYFIAIAKDFLECKFILAYFKDGEFSKGNYHCRFVSVRKAHSFLFVYCAPIHRFPPRKMNNSIVNKSFFFSPPRPPLAPLQYKVFFPCKAQTFISLGECFTAYRNSRKEEWKNGKMVKINSAKTEFFFLFKIYYTILEIAFLPFFKKNLDSIFASTYGDCF